MTRSIDDQVDGLDQVDVEAGLLGAHLVAVLAVAGDRHQPDPRQPGLGRIRRPARSRPSAAGRCRAARCRARTSPASPAPAARRTRPRPHAPGRPAPPRARSPRPRCRRRPACAAPPRAPPSSTCDRDRDCVRHAVAAGGQVTTNSLPLPEPLLNASTRPSCSATSDLTMLRPSPSPPSERSSPCRPCTNRSNTTGSISLRMPMPVSLTATRIIIAHAFGADGDRPARRRVLGGVRQQVPEHLRESRLVAVDDQPVSTSTVRWCMRCSSSGLASSIARAMMSPRSTADRSSGRPPPPPPPPPPSQAPRRAVSCPPRPSRCLRAVREQELHNARPAELHGAVQRCLAVAVRQRR